MNANTSAWAVASASNRTGPASAGQDEKVRTPTALREALPGCLLLGLAIVASTAALAWAFRTWGLRGPATTLPSLLALCGATVVTVRWRKAATRRRRGVYTPAELSDPASGADVRRHWVRGRGRPQPCRHGTRIPPTAGSPPGPVPVTNTDRSAAPLGSEAAA